MTYVDRATTRTGSANFPAVVSGKWHVDGQGSGAQGPVIVVNRAFFIPFWPGRPVTLAGLAINQGVAFTTPGTVRAGLYTVNVDTFLPETLVADYSTVVESAATLSGWTVSSAITARYPYCVCLVWQGGVTGSPTVSSRNIAHPLVVDITGSAINPNTNRTAYYSDTGYSGALPAAAGAMAGTMVGPSVAFKFTF